MGHGHQHDDVPHHHTHHDASQKSHSHAHAHPHEHEPHDVSADTVAALDTSIDDAELSPSQLSRRTLFRRAGVVGGAAALGASGVTPAMAQSRRRDLPPTSNQSSDVKLWLAGDHHIHTQHSSDGMYRVIDQVQHGRAYGMDWMVITDHGGATHARIGVDLVNPDIRAARELLPDTLVYQGLEWNIPAAEHGTVFVSPGEHELAVLKQFETDFDGGVNGTGSSSPENEARAVAGITWLGAQVDGRRIDDAAFFANHPARKGIDSPHELRNWRDADPRIALGFEGAPGHQAGGMPEGLGRASARGGYGNSPGGADAFPAYPAESYRTWGGFDWMTATVGGLWDSLLAEGKPWWITANSDSHVNWGDTSRRPDGSTREQFDRDGRYGAPVHGDEVNLGSSDFWPGWYSRTHVGAAKRDYLAVMEGLRAGRVWVDHGRLVKNLDVRLRAKGTRAPGVTLGSTLQVRYGARLELVVRITAQDLPNWAQFVPQLNRVDLIHGMVDPASANDRDTFVAPETKVVRQWDTSGRTGTFEIVHDLGPAYDPFYIRLRGTDAYRTQVGHLGAAIDPEGPAIDVVGDADPWIDLWFYTNPVWVVPNR